MAETQDTVEVTLPVSKKTVVIRNYTTRKDDVKHDEVLYSGVSMNQKQIVKDGKGKPDMDATESNIDFPISHVMSAKEVYVRRLVQSIDGDDKRIPERLEELHSKDYEAIDEKVGEIVEEHSPKAKRRKSAANKD